MSNRGRGKKRNREDGWEGWGGYMQAKQQKLQEQYAQNGLNSEIFKGISIHVNGYTKPSSDELKKLVIKNGGMYQHYLFKQQVTHVIATSLANSKITKDLKHMKIVKPEWITDSIACSKLLSYIPYQLYTAQSRIQTGMAGFTTSAGSTVSKLPHLFEEIDSATPEQQSSDHPVSTESNRKSPTNCRMDSNDMIQFSNIQNGTDDHSPELCQDNMLDYNSDEDFISGNSYKCDTDKNDSDALKGSHNTNHVSDKSVNLVEPTLSLKSVVQNQTSACEISGENKQQTDNLKESHNTSTSFSSDAQKSPNKIAKAGDDNFLSEFYGNSRLHHLSTWGAEFKAYVNKLQTENTDGFPGREELHKLHHQETVTNGQDDVMVVEGKTQRVIMHIDMDCFFVSVGLLNRPDLKGKPVAVTHSKNKGMSGVNPGSNPQYEFKQWQKKGNQGKQPNTIIDAEEESIPVELRKYDRFLSFAEIASCSYEARTAGVKNGMFMGPAKDLCPELQTIPYNFEKYQEISKILYNTVASYTHDIEAVSCDEMLVDCTDILCDTGVTPLQFSTILRQDVFNRTGCCASVGLGSNILLAKLSTRKAKPNGQFYLEDSDIIDFMRTQSVKDLPGVGWSMTKKLNNMNIKTCEDLQDVAMTLLQKEFGPKTGQSLYKSCRGQDSRPIKMEKERKSVSAEINYGIRFHQDSECVKFLNELSQEVHNRLQKVQLKGKVITLKLKVRREDAPKETAKFMGHGICNNMSKSATLPLATDDGCCIGKESIHLLKSMKVPVDDIRGIGIQVSRLEAKAGVKPDKSSQRNQSILNFTVTKTTSPTNHTQSFNTSKHNNSTIQSSSSIRQSLSTNNLFNNSHVRLTERGDNSPKLGCNMLTDVANNKESSFRKLFIPENTVTLNIGPSKMVDLSRTTAEDYLSPLGTLPCLTSLDSTHPGSISSAVESNNYFPSPSQVDLDVLKELPEDIRLQIEEELKLKITTPGPVPPDDQQPGCSHWPNPSVSDLLTSRSPEDDSPIVALPSPSQLDLECLNALPKELQDELKFAYKQQTNKQTIDKQKSPSKLSSPSKTRKTSPLFKVPKGRATKKRKMSPKKLQFSNRKKEVNETENLIKVIDTDEVICIESKHDVLPVNDNKEANMVEEEAVSLCGATDIKQVRALLSEWLHSCTVPQEDDIDVITIYIRQLILDQNLEFVDLVLKCLYRNVKKVDNCLWRKSLSSIVSSTQTTIQSLYGSQLNIQYMNS